MKNFRTYNLAVEFYKEARALSIRGPIRDQLLRASSSIALNLMEGRAKPTRKDQLKYFHIAMGSLRECQAILDLSERTKHSSAEKFDCLAAHLYRLIQRA